MIDNLDFGTVDEYPTRYNYNYASSMYLDSNEGPQGAARAYTEETRHDKMEGCEPCAGYSSIYYDRCYAKKGNQCIGRSYPQCMRGDPHCPQLEGPKKQLYNTMDEGKIDKVPKDDDDMNKETFQNNFTPLSLASRQKEGMNNYKLNDQRIILIAIIFICAIMLVSNTINQRKKINHYPNSYTFIQDGFSPYLIY
jgi:hypothetical protein